MPDLELALNQLSLKHKGHLLKFSVFNQSDLPILKQIYATTRQEELALTQWPEQQKSAFIEQQFVAQHSHYQTHYSGAEFLLIHCDGQILGRLYLDEGDQSICLIDITLLKSFQNNQLGSQILTWLIGHAEQQNKIITLHVEKHNPAHQWYLKSGFLDIESRGVYQYMEWHPR